MYDALLKMLGMAGDVVDTPASVFRGLVAAPFTGEWDRPFTGITDPSNRVHAEEWTGDPWSGAALDIAVDPMNIFGGIGLAKKLLNPKYDKVIDALKFGRGDSEIGKSLWFSNAKETAEWYARGENPVGAIMGTPATPAVKRGAVVKLSLSPEAKIAKFADEIPPGFIEDALPIRARQDVAGEFPEGNLNFGDVYAAADLSDNYNPRRLTRALKDAGYQGVARPILGDDWLEYGLWDKGALSAPGNGTPLFRGLPHGVNVPNPRNLSPLLAALGGYNAVRSGKYFDGDT